MTTGSKMPSPAKSGARRKAREFCLALLFQADVAGLSPGRVFECAEGTLDLLFEAWETGREERLKLAAEIEDFGRKLAEQYFIHAAEIDAVIEQLSFEWSLSRMPAIDRNILRMSLTELLHVPEVPVSATINEAVDLAKDYGTPESGKFVNGILGTFVRDQKLGKGNTEQVSE
jgi:transcription antitermination protein NusB